MIEYRDESSACQCCGGNIPAGKIRWTHSGECPGHLNGNLCGAIIELLQPSKKWLRESQRRETAHDKSPADWARSRP